MKPTTVISVRGQDRATLRSNPDFVYVGRRCAGWPATDWGNPFKVDRMISGHETPEKIVTLFREHLLGSLEYRLVEPYMPSIAYAFDVMARRLPELKSKALGCWCGHWSPGQPEIACHAVVLAKLADELEIAPHA